MYRLTRGLSLSVSHRTRRRALSRFVPFFFFLFSILFFESQEVPLSFLFYALHALSFSPPLLSSLLSFVSLYRSHKDMRRVKRKRREGGPTKGERGRLEASALFRLFYSFCFFFFSLLFRFFFFSEKKR